MYENFIKGCGEMNFGKIVTAMVTPFDSEGEIDFAATENLIEHLIDNGTDAIVVAGTTGESPTISYDEKVALFKFVVNRVDKRIPIIAGTGSNDTRKSVNLTIDAEASDVDAIMLVAPYYNRPSQEGLFQHFKTIAESTTLPIMLYNIPGRTSVNINVDTIIRLSEIENIVAIKEASGDLDALAEIIEQTKDDFCLYSGDDSMALPVLAIGGVGIVSVSSHILGNEMAEMIDLFKAGRNLEAAAIHRKLMPKFNAIFSAPNPISLKSALNFSGVPVGGVRLPLMPLNEEETAALKVKLQN